MRIGRQIAEGLAAAHATDLIHRDIKPGNVLIEGGQSRVKITDFGLARAADDASISQSGIIAGTPMYMAPEQALGHKLDQRADLFSLGSVLYQMVAGRPPFRANSTVAVLKRVAEDTPRSIREIVPETPQWLCDIIAKLHAKNPDERFQSAREVADVLAECETRLKAGAKSRDFPRIPKIGTGAPAVPRKRYPWKWALVPAAVVLFALILLGVSPSARRFAVGKGEIEVATDSARSHVVVRGSNTNAYEVTKGTLIEVASGRYTLQLAPAPGKTHQEWRITSHGFFSSTTVNHATGDKGSVVVEVSPGERVTVRVVVRDEQIEIVPPTTPPLPTDYALNFATPTSHVAFPGLKLPTSEPMTIEGYVTVRDNNNSLLFNMRTPNHVRITLGGSVGFWVGSVASPVQRAMMGEGLPVDRRIHLACVYDGKSPSLFVDGIRQSAPISLVKLPEAEAVEARLGTGKARKGDNMFNGIVDEFRISTVARYKGNFTPERRFAPDKDTLALYHCDDGQGDTLTDSSGNGHHGRLSGATWINAGDSTPVEFKNSVGMEFVRIPKGKSWLGGGKDKLGDKEVEFAGDFYLGKFHVTQEEWEKVMEYNPSFYSRNGEGRDAVKDVSDADLKRFPVDTVSWDACQIYVAKLNNLEKDSGWVYRLPKEAEWEYACRGGPMTDNLNSAFDFYFAKPANAAGNLANLNTGTADNPVSLGRTCKVGSYEPNSLGLHDMHGNLHVWCDDAAKTFDGFDGYAMRGGAWNTPTELCSAASRLMRVPSSQSQSHGLRLARVPASVPSPAAKSPAAEPDRRAAEHVLKVGGAIQINNQAEFINAAAGLPKEAFRLTTVHLLFKLQVTDADLAHLKGCENLTEVRLSGCTEVTDVGIAHLKDSKNLLGLGLDDTKVSNAGLVHFKDCKNLILLSLSGTAISDEGVAHFTDCKEIADLDLNGTPITDAGLASFRGCTKLRRLCLARTKVGDAGLAHFKYCKLLVTLFLSDAPVGNEGLSHFKDCEGMMSLHLNGTKATGAALARFKDRTKLELVDLDGIPVGDADLANLKGCTNLATLILSNTTVGDAGLVHLKELKNLKTLNLQKTKVSAKGIEELKKALPECKIE